ncbi:MAG: hypothetical protein ACJ762_11605 [Solirubrobacteraceae bacterium]
MNQRLRIKIVAAALGLVATSLVWSGGTFSSFNKTSAMPSNSVAAGSVTIDDNDAGTAAFELAAARPSSTDTGCVQVSYTGDVASTVRLVGTIGGTGLAPYLTLTVTRGTFSSTPAAGSCTGFTADATGSVIYNGTLSAFPATTGTALSDTSSWTAGTKHAYRFVITLPSGVASGAQGLTATAAFTWQAVSS